MGADEEAWSAFRLDVANAHELMQECLLELGEQAGHNADALNRLYRALHTLKGITRMMNLPNIERVAHLAEDMVSIARDEEQALSEEAVDTLLAATDFLHHEAYEASRSHRDADLGRALAITKVLEQYGKQRSESRVPTKEEDDGFVLFSMKPGSRVSSSAGRAELHAAPMHEPAAKGTLPVAAAHSEASPQGDVSGPQKGAAPTGTYGQENDEYVRVQASKVKAVLDLAAEVGLAAHAVTNHPLVHHSEDETLVEANRQLGALLESLPLQPAPFYPVEHQGPPAGHEGATKLDASPANHNRQHTSADAELDPARILPLDEDERGYGGF